VVILLDSIQNILCGLNFDFGQIQPNPAHVQPLEDKLNFKFEVKI
jgi:hypothetical protein